MPFIQVIEYRTSHWDEVQDLISQYRKDTEDTSTAGRVTICVDRSAPGRHVAIVEFPSYEAALENSNLPETEEMAQAILELCDEPPVFRNLEVSMILERDAERL
jgi:quinol monooxygenase YgiN